MAILTSTTPIVALDVSSDAEALALVDDLGDLCRFYKIGNELFTACGPSIVREVIADARRLGLPVRLQVLKTNPRARQLYERLGFRLFDETTSHWIMRTEQ